MLMHRARLNFIAEYLRRLNHHHQKGAAVIHNETPQPDPDEPAPDPQPEPEGEPTE